MSEKEKDYKKARLNQSEPGFCRFIYLLESYLFFSDVFLPQMG